MVRVNSTNGALLCKWADIMPTLSKLDGFNAALGLTIATSFYGRWNQA
jgi:hypothetical protein